MLPPPKGNATARAQSPACDADQQAGRPDERPSRRQSWGERCFPAGKQFENLRPRLLSSQA
eukprot:1610850-Pyramimonas_sp.AAC.1